jgi:hypothetical protein
VRRQGAQRHGELGAMAVHTLLCSLGLLIIQAFDEPSNRIVLFFVGGLDIPPGALPVKANLHNILLRAINMRLQRVSTSKRDPLTAPLSIKKDSQDLR